MSAHTPGPWIEETRDTETDEDTIIRAIHNDLTIARVGDGDLVSDRDYANARLIAAAPELLEALKNLLNPIANGWKVSDMALRIEEAQAAIAKAESSIEYEADTTTSQEREA